MAIHFAKQLELETEGWFPFSIPHTVTAMGHLNEVWSLLQEIKRQDFKPTFGTLFSVLQCQQRW